MKITETEQFLLDIERDLEGRFESVEQLDKGGMGVLYRAHKISLDVDVVIKRTKAKFKGKVDEKSEANILKNLKHSYLPRIYDIVESPSGYIYTVMDYIPGENLKQYVTRHGKIDQKTAYKWLCQLCEVVIYLHRQTPPIIHCDIKPSNIMVTPEGNICLIDFNTSLIYSDGVLAMAATPGYAAPEQYTKKSAAPVDDTPVKKPIPKVDPVEAYQDETLLGEADGTVLGTAPYFGETRLEDDTYLGELPPLEPMTAPKIQGSAPPVQKAEDTSPEGTGSSVSSYASATAAQTMRAGGYGGVTKRTDVYSIGASFYYALTGTAPAHSLHDVKPLRSYRLPISRAMLDILECAMQKQPEMRFANAEKMLEALRDVENMDVRYKKHTAACRLAAVVLGVAMTVSIASTAYGSYAIHAERENAYLTLLSDGISYVEQWKMEEGQASFEQAIQLFPGRADGYINLAALLYRQGKYMDAELLLENALVAGTLETAQLSAEDNARICFIRANCFFETGQYENALIEYEEAIQYDGTLGEAIRGAAIAQAKTGQLDAAEKTLMTLKGLEGFETDCEMVSAEISAMKGEDEKALVHYETALDSAEDEETLRRGYLAAAQISERLEDVDKEIELLEEAAESLSGGTTLHEELLASAYSKKAESDPENQREWYRKAEDTLTGLVEQGYETLATGLNLALVQETMGEYDSAEATLKEIIENFPEDYRGYMRLAFLYADWQTRRSQESRNYQQVAQLYEQARQFYERAQANGVDDMEMLRLKELVNQLRSAGWL